MNYKSNLKKMTLTAIFVAISVVGSMFSFPVFGSKCAPVQHLVNILCAVTVGPWWGLAQAFAASLIRNLTGLGTLLAFPGSICGALIGGLLYKALKKLPFAYIGEVFGTGVIGGMLIGTLALLFLVPSLFIVFQYMQEKIRPVQYNPTPDWAIQAELEDANTDNNEEEEK